MPNIQQLLNDEIRRLARKEINIAVKDLKAQTSALRKTITEQNRKIKELEKQLLSSTSVKSSAAAPQSVNTDDSSDKTLRSTAERITKWRTRLGLKRAQYAKLLEVSPLSVSHWERGLSTPRSAQKQRIAELRDMGKRELVKLCAAKGIKLHAEKASKAHK